jgi:heat shock protein HslJ
MAGPPELMQLEQTFFAAIASTKTVSFAETDLVLENAESVTRLTFRKTDFETVLKALYGKTLFLRRMIAGSAEVTLPDATITLTLGADGRVSGRAPVNSYFGAYKRLGNGGIEMSGPFGTTRMAGPPELMQSEDTFLRALAGVERIRPSADGVTLENASKNIVLDFGLSQ